MKKIIINFIPHERQRYDTVGDWFEEDGVLILNISKMKNEYFEVAVALHEMIEWFLCRIRKIPESAVTAWDLVYEGKGEPGDAKGAPYRKEHRFATKLEKLLIVEAGLDWQEYDDVVESL